jgi:hypothetical protein
MAPGGGTGHLRAGNGSQPVNAAYFGIRFRGVAPTAIWPSSFTIVSAYATTGEEWLPDRSQAADEALGRELAGLGVWVTRVVGYSPTTGHSEPSWAAELSVEEGRRLGQQFHQDAIFSVAGDQLTVSSCRDEQSVNLGSFLARLD